MLPIVQLPFTHLLQWSAMPLAFLNSSWWSWKVHRWWHDHKPRKGSCLKNQHVPAHRYLFWWKPFVYGACRRKLICLFSLCVCVCFLTVYKLRNFLTLNTNYAQQWTLKGSWLVEIRLIKWHAYAELLMTDAYSFFRYYGKARRVIKCMQLFGRLHCNMLRNTLA